MPRHKTNVKPSPLLSVVELSGPDGNIYVVGGIAGRAMLDIGLSACDVADMWRAVHRCRSYREALATVMAFAPIEFVRNGHYYNPMEETH